ncbi:MAG: HD domain-containing phosphohydrolase [Acidimicrobiales bacterium]
MSANGFDVDFTLQSVLPACGAIDATAMGWILFDADVVVRDVNATASVLLGLTREAMLGRSLGELPYVAYSEAGLQLSVDEGPVGQSLRTGVPVFVASLRLRVEGGASRWLSVSAFPYVVDGAVRAVAVSYSDVTRLVVARNSWEVLLDVARLSRTTHTREEYLSQLCDALVTSGGYALAVVTAGIGEQTGFVDGAGLDEEFQRILAKTDSTAMRGDGLTGMAIRTGTVQIVNDLSADPAATYWRHHIERLHLRSAAAFPISLGGEVLTLTVFSYLDHHFDQLVTEGIAMMLDEVAAGLARVDAVEQIERALSGTLAALAEMSELRDPYTAGHQRNVGRLGAAIAARLGVDAALVALIDQAGTVHDIGKISIPAEILTRPGRLSALEFEIMRTHADVGYAILTKARLPWPIPEVARQHHERLDGSGYPLGLTGDDIDLPARIIAVADVVEAMAHHRPYRAAPGLEAALAEIARGAGTIYDARVAQACRDAFDEGFTFTAPTPLGGAVREARATP